MLKFRNIVIAIISMFIILYIIIIVVFISNINQSKDIESEVKERIIEKATEYLTEKYGDFDYSVDDYVELYGDLDYSTGNYVKRDDDSEYDFKCEITMLTDVSQEEHKFSVIVYGKDEGYVFDDTYLSLLINNEAEMYIKKIIDGYYSNSKVYGQLSGHYYSNDIKEVSQYNEIEFENDYLEFCIDVDATGQTYNDFIESMNKIEAELTDKIRDGETTFCFIVNGVTSYGLEHEDNRVVMEYEIEFK